MNAAGSRAPATTQVPVWLPRAFAVMCGAFSLLALFAWARYRHASFLGLWPLFDWHDMHVYFLSSGWVVGEGTLYREVASEYRCCRISCSLASA